MVVIFEGKYLPNSTVFSTNGVFKSEVPVGSLIQRLVMQETISIWVNNDNPEIEYIQLLEEPTRPTDFLQLYEELEKAKEEIKNLKEENKLDKEHFANYVEHVNAYGSIP